MGYDVHITRAADWSENAGHEITAAEWMAVVRADGELVPDPKLGPYAVRWSKTAWIDWFDGNVFTTDPDRATVGKLLEIAQRLSAAVQGDDGEFYENARDWPQARRTGAQRTE
ncbi:MAG TPA: hypothetical protein VK081_04345 [Planctomycetota bacterium]|nr:hypothetical protein [Planctomycetota bacterium]